MRIPRTPLTVQRFNLSVNSLFKFIETTMIIKLVGVVVKAVKGASARNIDNALETQSVAAAGGDREGDEEEPSGRKSKDGDSDGSDESDDDVDKADVAEDAGTLQSKAASRHTDDVKKSFISLELVTPC